MVRVSHSANTAGFSNPFTSIFRSYTFKTPLVLLRKNVNILELFHGPTLAFKDYAVRFMARCMEKLLDQKITLLVATSGDTGSAVANGFLGLNGINVIILYPSNRVSDIQEKQLTTYGRNVSAICSKYKLGA